MNARPQVVDADLPLEKASDLAIGELQSTSLSERHLPAEQLANAALQNLEQGRAADAGVWLSLASYRYSQEWSRILRSGRGAALQDDLPQVVANEILNRELEVYGALDFRLELRAVARLVRGEEPGHRALQLRLAAMFGGFHEDEESVSEAIRQKLVERGEHPERPTTTKALSKAYLGNLRTNAKGRERVSAFGALISTPSSLFALESLSWGFDDVSPGYWRDVVNQLSTETQYVVERLANPEPRVRSNAAIVLGMNPNPENVPELGRLQALEKDPGVRLSVAYALARHGQRERVADLTNALKQECPSGRCQDAMNLISWLPNDLTSDLDPELFLKLASELGQRLPVRLAAIGTLADIGSTRSLSPRARAAMFSIAREKNRELVYAATRALARDVGFSRELVLAELANPTSVHGPLLERLAVVATVADLPLLQREMGHIAGEPGAGADALINAAARLTEAEAEVQLLRWFEAYPSLRRKIALRLMARSTRTPSTDAHLAAAKDGDVHLLVRVLGRAPDALQLLQTALQSADVQHRLFATMLGGLTMDPGIKPQLWSLVNFRDDRYYPHDARLRNAAMSALLWIAIDELIAVRAAAEPVSTL